MTSLEKRPTVADSIIADLRESAESGTCGSYWYATFRPTFAQRISLDLRARGFVVASEPCHEHEHRGPIHRYRLVVDPERKMAQGALGL